MAQGNDALDQLEGYRGLGIICTSVYRVRCGACKRSESFYIQIPVSEELYFGDPVLCDGILSQRFDRTEAKHILDRQYACPSCEARDCDIGFVDRMPDYRDGDELRLPVERVVA